MAVESARAFRPRPSFPQALQQRVAVHFLVCSLLSVLAREMKLMFQSDIHAQRDVVSLSSRL
eukprot:8648047-Pyramimonas_sp.AAC.1